jgi:P27 family predicted phage terminase small subunit
MGRRGPKPTPTAELAARGSWLADVRKGEPDAPPGVPEPPEYLRGEAREYWFRLWPTLTAMQIASPAYLEQAIALCEAWAHYRDVQRRWSSAAASTDWLEQIVPLRRLASMLNEALLAFNRLSANFGQSPADKTRVRAERATDGKDDREKKFGLAG